MTPDHKITFPVLPLAKPLVYGWYRNGSYRHVGIAKTSIDGAFKHGVLGDELHLWQTDTPKGMLARVQEYAAALDKAKLEDMR